MEWIRRLTGTHVDPAPPGWREVLDRRLPYFGLLDEDAQVKLLKLTNQFLTENRFEGAHGRPVQEEKQITIAAQACLLLLGWDPGRLFPTLRTVILYPGVYRADETVRRPEGTEIRQRQTRSGESWSHGTVLLSWQDVRTSARDPHDGYNVVLHEFAHQLDEETGEANGAPALKDRKSYETWQSVWAAAFQQLQTALTSGRPAPFLSEYASESPAEFFAVATEWFFELPHDLHDSAPELFEQLVGFYRQDPRSYLAN